MTYLYLDIETIPTGDEAARAYLGSKVEAPANYKDAEKIAAFKAEAAETAWVKSSFDGFFGRAACIGWAFGNDGIKCANWEPGDDITAGEPAMLADVLRQMTEHMDSGRTYAPPTIVGHNIAGFDLPFLTRRMVALGIHIPAWWPRNPKPWDQKIVDTMLLPGGRDMLSLDHICHALSIPGKQGVTGADVWPMWQKGKHTEIVEYCRDDVERVRAVHRKFLEVGW